MSPLLIIDYCKNSLPKKLFIKKNFGKLLKKARN